MALLYPLPKRTTIRAYGPKTSTRDGNYRAGRIKPIRLLVIHDGETGEGSTPAEGMGNWFANPAANASSHAGFDTDSICTYVDDEDTAFCAPGANADGLHGEFAGRASQTTSQWKDADSLRILENGAIWFAEKCIKRGIPARYLTDAQVKDGTTKGITTHRQCTRVLGGSHTDPGPNFPYDYFLARVKFHISRITAPTVKPIPTIEEDDLMAVSEETARNLFTGFAIMKNPENPTGDRVAPSFVLELAAAKSVQNSKDIAALKKSIDALTAAVKAAG